jgi:hypothetical protein
MLKIKVYPDLYSPHMTQIYSGLYDLAKEGKINLEITARVDCRIKTSQRNSVLCIEVYDSVTALKKLVCFDMYDGCDISSVGRLELSDVYFKRSYCDKCIGTLDVLQSGKILPYGLNFECRTKNERDIFKRLFVYHRAGSTLSNSPIRFFRHVLTELVAYACLRFEIGASNIRPMSVGDMVVRPDEPAEPRILFQTRLWAQEECPRISGDQLSRINQVRVDTIRSLRRRFGRQFSGGLIPTDSARRNFPDCCLKVSEAKRRNYLNLVRKCLVCVTTAGLHDSTGFKFPEYLAASRCIVTEPPKYKLPVPVVEGRNYLAFRTPEECVSACGRLLADQQLAEQMRHENHRYYLEEVDPSALIFKRLKAAMRIQEPSGQTTLT